MERNVRNSFNERRNGNNEPDGVPMWKSVAVVAVLIGCFAAVYPKMFHPIVVQMFGNGQSNTFNEGDDDRPPHAPRPMGIPPGRPHSQDFHPHSGPPPPMRMAQHPGQMDAQQRSSSKAMWHWMLPFYTIGVIVFLLYTLGKIFFKQPKRDQQRVFNFNYNASNERFEMNGNDGGYKDFNNPGNLSDNELRRLQVRLQETESAMHKILTQLEQLSGNVDPSAAEDLKRVTMETLNNIGYDNDSEKVENLGSQNVTGMEKTYMKDLDNALNDFKKFTEDYIEEHTKANISDASAAETMEKMTNADGPVARKEQPKNPQEGPKVQENEETTTHRCFDKEKLGFDVMESEDLANLVVENGEGEIIDVKNDDDTFLRRRIVPSDSKTKE